MCISVDLAHTTADDGSEIFLPTLLVMLDAKDS